MSTEEPSEPSLLNYAKASTQEAEISQLELAKLRLEIADLRRPHWLRPGVVIPLIVGVVTIGYTQYSGFFDVQRQRNENAAFKADQENKAAQATMKDLEVAKAKLQGDIAKLAVERKEIEARQSTLAREELI